MIQDRPLKFLVLSAKGWGTGSALRASYIAQALRQRGHHAVFVRPLPNLPLWLDMALSTFYYPLWALTERYDAVLAVKPYPTVMPALWLQKILGAKLILDLDDLDYAYSRGWFRSLHKALQRPWPALADFVTFHNLELEKTILREFGVDPGRLVRLPQGVDTELFKPAKPAEKLLPEALLSPAPGKKNGPLFVFTAHLNVACDLEPVLESFRLILKDRPGARLAVAGGGPDERRFKNMASEMGIGHSVLFTGSLGTGQVAACLNAADAALVYYSQTPANAHRSSLKLREALACGRPVIATAVGESRDWGPYVLLSKPNPRDFAGAMKRFLKSPKGPAKKSAQGRKMLVKHWSWSACVENLEKKLQRA